jgi:protein-L-isoaspartate(D-aspartate) O-methyltransferase
MPEPTPGELRARLVAALRDRGALARDDIAAAFAAVPRHLFVPGEPLERAYADEALVTRVEDGLPASSSSQPSMMAVMLEQLAPAPGQRVLEIGAGTGYNAAVLAELVGPAGAVTTLDITPEVAAAARAHLVASGAPRVEVRVADGADGAPDRAPFDRIIATAACWEIPPAWPAQLADGGILVLPLRLNGAQVSMALQRRGRRRRGGRRPARSRRQATTGTRAPPRPAAA